MHLALHEQKTGNLKRKEFLDSLPAGLQRELVQQMFGDVLRKVPLFDMLCLTCSACHMLSVDEVAAVCRRR